MDKRCPKCSRSFKQDEDIKAVVIAKYVHLKSNVIYSISRPTECLAMEHINCTAPIRYEGD